MNETDPKAFPKRYAKKSHSQRPSSYGHWKFLASASVFLVERNPRPGQSEPDFPDPRQSTGDVSAKKRRIADGIAMWSREPTRAIAWQPVVSDRSNSEGHSRASGKSRAGGGRRDVDCCVMENRHVHGPRTGPRERNIQREKREKEGPRHLVCWAAAAS